MNVEHEPSVAQSVINWRMWLAESIVAAHLFPVKYKDEHGSMDVITNHLRRGGSVVFITSHPSLEDVVRIERFMFLWDEIRERRIGGPGAKHMKGVLEQIKKPFDIEMTYMTTRNTLEKMRKSGKRKGTHEERQKEKEEAERLLVDVLSHNGIWGVALSADQAPKLTKPALPVVGFILENIIEKNVSEVMFVPVGIEIEGLDNYDLARRPTLARHPYIFNVGPTFTTEELMRYAEEDQVDVDTFIYERLRELVPAEYL